MSVCVCENVYECSVHMATVTAVAIVGAAAAVDLKKRQRKVRNRTFSTSSLLSCFIEYDFFPSSNVNVLLLIVIIENCLEQKKNSPKMMHHTHTHTHSHSISFCFCFFVVFLFFSLLAICISFTPFGQNIQINSNAKY